MVVHSLYTNIPHNEGIKAVETTSKCKDEPTTVIATFLKLILTDYSFILNCKNYFKANGYAKESRCAPNLVQHIYENL